MAYKFRKKFKDNVQKSKTAWKEQVFQTTEKRYVNVNNSEMIAEMLLDAYTRGAENHPKIKAFLQEYATNQLGYYPLHILTDENKQEIIKPFQFGGYMWESQEGIEVRPFDNDSASNLNAIELNVFPFETMVIRDKEKGNTYYDKSSHTMWKPCKSRFERFGFISMNMDSKSPEPTGIECGRAYDQFTALSKVFTTRSCKQKKEFESDCFLKTIGEATYEDYTNKSGRSIRPITLVDDKNGIRETFVTNFTSGETVSRKSYNLTDLILVLDIDNGKQIEYIKESLLKLPYTPQYITQEKGMGKTKKGNSTALLVVDAPMTKEQRQLLLKAYRYILCCKYDVYAIDCNCTGTGYGKNPLKTYKAQLQRQFQVLVNGENYRETTPLQSAISWAEEVVASFESSVDEYDDKFISSCEELKNSTLTYSEIIRKLNETKEEFYSASSMNTVFLNTVFEGMRNDQFTKIEGPVYALQYYLLHGIDSVYDENTAVNMMFAVKNDILSRYENKDNSITNEWILKRLRWIVEQDKKALQGINTRKAFLSSLYYQRNICIHNKECRLMFLEGYSDFKESRFKAVKEFEELGLKHRYSATQQRHGADTQSIKSVLYASCKLGEDIIPILEELRKNEKMCYEQTDAQDSSKILPLISPAETDKNRRTFISNILLSKVAAEYTMKQYEIENGYGFSVESYKNKSNANSVAFWDFSLRYNKKFLDMEYSDRKELIYHIALYINEYCDNILKFGITNSGCKFSDIKSNHIKSICKALYTKFGVNISIVHHIAISIKDKPKTPKELYFELCTMNTREVANKIVSVCAKAQQLSESVAEAYFQHRYRPDVEFSGHIKTDIQNILTQLIAKNKDKNSIKRWISNDVLSHVRTMIESLKSQDYELYQSIYKTIRKVVNSYITDFLQLPTQVIVKSFSTKRGLFTYVSEREEGNDGLNNYVDNSTRFFSKISHLQVVNNIA